MCIRDSFTTSQDDPVKGIILAGGTGSRLWPVTRGVSKQLLPVFDKPMVHYPLATLMAAGLRDVLIITTPEDASSFTRLFGDGSDLGIHLTYATQDAPGGLAEAFLIGADFLDGDAAALILGDNLFYGPGLGRQLRSCTDPKGGFIFAYEVADPRAYGVVELDADGYVVSLEEKPTVPKSRYAIPGLYFYADDVVDIARSIQPSARGELEITAINQAYLDDGRLEASVLPRGTAWLDTGTFTDLQAAGEYVRVIEERQGTKIACLEEIAWRNGWIDSEHLLRLAEPLRKSGYGDYLLRLVNAPAI